MLSNEGIVMTNEEFTLLPVGTRLVFQTNDGPALATKNSTDTIHWAEKQPEYKGYSGSWFGTTIEWRNVFWQLTSTACVIKEDNTLPAGAPMSKPEPDTDPIRPPHFPWKNEEEKRMYFYGREYK